jgi:hypothetical protein
LLQCSILCLHGLPRGYHLRLPPSLGLQPYVLPVVEFHNEIPSVPVSLFTAHHVHDPRWASKPTCCPCMISVTSSVEICSSSGTFTTTPVVYTNMNMNMNMNMNTNMDVNAMVIINHRSNVLTLQNEAESAWPEHLDLPSARVSRQDSGHLAFKPLLSSPPRFQSRPSRPCPASHQIFSSRKSLDAWMLGCLDAWMLGSYRLARPMRPQHQLKEVCLLCT